MNKTELVEMIAKKSGQPKTVANAVLDATLESIVEAVAAGDSVRLIGFGTFGVANRAARTGRNPQTGTVIQIPACKAPKFTPGASFKDAIK